LALEDGRKAVAAKGDFTTAHTKLGTALLGLGRTEEAYGCFAKAMAQDSQGRKAASGRQACLGLLPLWKSISAKKRHRNRFAVDLIRPTARIYAISDVFFDHKDNEEWAHAIDDFKFSEDVLIIAGNMCNTRNALARALVTFKSKFRRVFYVPGNHEMQIAGEQQKYSDSFTKLLAIIDVCDEVGVDIAPAAVCKGVFIVPLLSWYTAEFDLSDPYPDPKDNKTDNHCLWPMDKDNQVWKYLLALNAAHLRHPYHGTVITFSHFVPRYKLAPAYGSRAAKKTMGCERIDAQARAVGSKLHVYGHAKKHFWAKEDDVIYVNHYHGTKDEWTVNGAAGYPQLLQIYNGSNIRKTELNIV
jgi:UDP-2,3-diacylglucosamine pyrophosphatase LpxH